WDYCFRTGVSEYNNAERLEKFSSWVEDGAVWVDRDEIEAWEREHPQPYRRDAFQGAYQDIHG
ncbi:MAG: glutamate synthase, partial [Xanthomonadales bacterium]|nr:glutamate synthase [Xanthomonadales bacterium]